ncbi:MAG: hypothetical protein AB7G47_05550 [Mycolicibacterium sp.]|uniref:hypothetical protein n=1 Tax=Mycolicibacterium sp. TaxID=2320850 RepID=UPI003D0F512F
MPAKRLHLASLLVAAAGLVALAPVAAADPAAGSESPDTTKQQLESQGYQVTVNWVNGIPDVVPLSQCVVTKIDTSAPPQAYMSVACPPAGSQ